MIELKIGKVQFEDDLFGQFLKLVSSSFLNLGVIPYGSGAECECEEEIDSLIECESCIKRIYCFQNVELKVSNSRISMSGCIE